MQTGEQEGIRRFGKVGRAKEIQFDGAAVLLGRAAGKPHPELLKPRALPRDLAGLV